MHRSASSALVLLNIGAALLLPDTLRAANCRVTATPLRFGNYNPLATTPSNRNGRITVTCNGQGTFIVALSTGQSGSYTQRYMRSGTTGDQLDYNLYTNPARTVIFGDGNGGTQTVSKTFRNNTNRVTVYGQIPAMENIAAGRYTDSITATVTF